MWGIHRWPVNNLSICWRHHENWWYTHNDTVCLFYGIYFIPHWQNMAGVGLRETIRYAMPYMNITEWILHPMVGHSINFFDRYHFADFQNYRNLISPVRYHAYLTSVLWSMKVIELVRHRHLCKLRNVPNREIHDPGIAHVRSGTLHNTYRCRLSIAGFQITVTSREGLRSSVSRLFAQNLVRITDFCDMDSPHKGTVKRKAFPFH